MKTKLILLPFIAFLLASCATVEPGNDATLVNAERVTNLATDAFDSFFQLERSQDAWVKAHAPAVHKFANDLRRNHQRYLASARAETEAYRLNRTAENKANLNTAIGVLQEALNQINLYTPELQSKTMP